MAVGISLLALVGVLAQSELLLELAAQLTVGGNELLANVDNSIARSDDTVSLDTQQNLRHIRMSNCGRQKLAVEQKRRRSFMVTYSCRQRIGRAGLA